MAPERAVSLVLAELARQIRLDLQAIEAEAAELARGRAAAQEPDSVWLAFLAVHLDRFYTAAEATFERTFRALGEPLPVGDHWHHIALHQASLAIQDVRPAVIGGDTETRLQPLLKFRHWLRHAYRTPFEWSLMSPVVDAVPDALRGLQRDLAEFLRWIDATGETRD